MPSITKEKKRVSNKKIIATFHKEKKRGINVCVCTKERKKERYCIPFQPFLHPRARDFVNVLTAFNIPVHSLCSASSRLKGMIDAWHATDTPTTPPGLRWIFRTIYPLNGRGAVSAGIPAISNNSYISWSTSWNNREMNSRERWKSAGRSFLGRE